MSGFNVGDIVEREDSARTENYDEESIEFEDAQRIPLGSRGEVRGVSRDMLTINWYVANIDWGDGADPTYESHNTPDAPHCWVLNQDFVCKVDPMNRQSIPENAIKKKIKYLKEKYESNRSNTRALPPTGIYRGQGTVREVPVASQDNAGSRQRAQVTVPNVRWPDEPQLNASTLRAFRDYLASIPSTSSNAIRNEF